jgi:hypothetical protein
MVVKILAILLIHMISTFGGIRHKPISHSEVDERTGDEC